MKTNEQAHDHFRSNQRSKALFKLCPSALPHGCPIENNIPQFIRALSEGNIGLAYEIISERSNLPAICGRVCPHERRVKRTAFWPKTNTALKSAFGNVHCRFCPRKQFKTAPPSTGKRGKVAVIGSGPGRPYRCRRPCQNEFCRYHF